MIFLERLQQYEPLPSDHIVHLASTYTLSTTVNAEVRLRFYQVALSDPEAPAAKQFGPEAVKWVTGEDTGMVVGRMKFCRPIFKLVYKVDEELAVTAFGKAKNAFHPIARNLIEKVRRLYVKHRMHMVLTNVAGSPSCLSPIMYVYKTLHVKQAALAHTRTALIGPRVEAYRSQNVFAPDPT